MANATAVVDLNSSLVRKSWMKEGMIQAASNHSGLHLQELLKKL
jgi:hypothetical protein